MVIKNYRKFCLSFESLFNFFYFPKKYLVRKYQHKSLIISALICTVNFGIDFYL